MKFKLRWNNGFGYEDGIQVPYSYYLENKETKERIKLCTPTFEGWLDESGNTLNDFRNHNERELTNYLVEHINEFKEVQE